MLAGEQGTGKTTIARYLIGKGPTKMRKSTDGIGLYTGLSYIDRETDEWLDGRQGTYSSAYTYKYVLVYLKRCINCFF